MACAKIKRTKYMRNINDNAVQGRLSENYLTRKIIAWNILGTKYSRTSECLVIEGCGQIHTATAIDPTNVSLTCNVELRSQEIKLELLTILKTSIHAYAVSLPRYAYTVLTRNQSIDDTAHRFESAISCYLFRLPYTPFTRETLHWHVYCSRPAVFNIALWLPLSH